MADTLGYIKAMRKEAEERRAEAKGLSEDWQQWYNDRAKFFDACADEAQAVLDAKKQPVTAES